jgi:8-oxo-dGTP diphosphatase
MMKRVPYVSVIAENMQGEVLLLLRDNKSTQVFPNHWTLIGGKVENDETPGMSAQRELQEDTGLEADLTFWREYDRPHPLFIVDQYIYVGKVDASQDSLVLGEGQALQFFKRSEIQYLKIGYGFKTLLNEYFLTTVGDLHVHHS